jgi:ATP-dependent DNA helicase RecG
LKGNTDKGTQTSSQRIISIMRQNSATTIEELSKDLGISSRAIKKHIKSLREQGIIKRVGHDFGGHWEVVPFYSVKQKTEEKHGRR